MAWDTSPPLPRTRLEIWPTLLFSWWCTIFSAVVILVRLLGRKTRSNVLFREDWVMMAALIPLFIRMAFIHVVLVWGTNNVQTVGYNFTPAQIRHRSIGARLVLCARIFYAMYIWICKLTVSEFLKRITVRTWRRSYELTLQGIRIFLLVTFVAVVLATLTECQPFHEYWQVVPEARPACRLGYAQLITMGACDIITDILLVAFPIPIVLRSGQNWKRKLQLALLFSLSVVMIGVTGTRVPKVISKHGRQQYRSVWASCEILAATATTNMIIIGSFLRDKGTKKNKYRSQSVTDSRDTSVRRPTLRRGGSEEDLFRELGVRIPQHLLDEDEPLPRPAPAALSAKDMRRNGSTTPKIELGDGIPPEARNGNINGTPHHSNNNGQPLPSPSPSTKRSVSFFDVGGLLEDSAPPWDAHSRSTTLADSGTSGVSGPVAQDFAATSASNLEPSRRGSRAFLSDIGGILTPAVSRNSNNGSYTLNLRRQPDSQQPSQRNRASAAPIGVLGPMLERHETRFSLQDAGGLLAEEESYDEDDLYMSSALRDNAAESAHTQSEDNASPTAATASRSVARLEHRGNPADAAPTHVQRQGEAYKELELHDPGGLLSRD